MRYIYHYIRKDISHTQRIIQSIHSGYELALNLDPFEDRKPSSVVLFEVEDEAAIVAVMREMMMAGMIPDRDFHAFFEPDRNEGWTSISTRPMTGEERDWFRGYTLYTDELDTEGDLDGRTLLTEGHGL